MSCNNGVDVNQVQTVFSAESQKKSGGARISSASVVALVAVIVAIVAVGALVYVVVTPASSSNVVYVFVTPAPSSNVEYNVIYVQATPVPSSNVPVADWPLVGLYVDPAGRSMEFITENYIEMSTPDAVQNSTMMASMKSYYNVTYTKDGNKLTLFTYISQADGSLSPMTFGHATVSDDKQEIVFCDDVYTKK